MINKRRKTLYKYSSKDRYYENKKHKHNTSDLLQRLNAYHESFSIAVQFANTDPKAAITLIRNSLTGLQSSIKEVELKLREGVQYV